MVVLFDAKLNFLWQLRHNKTIIKRRANKKILAIPCDKI